MKAYAQIQILILITIISAIFSCKNDKQTIDPEPVAEIIEILPASSQRNGNVDKGYDYLVNGNYVDGGIPFSLWLSLRGEDNSNILKRQGNNAKVKYQYTVITTSNNTLAVGANCLNCHASYINN
jgi:hypothetical protein